MTREWNRRAVAVDDVSFEERFAELKEILVEQFVETEGLSALIQTKLED